MNSNKGFIFISITTMLLLLSNCKKEVTKPPQEFLKIQFIEGYIAADLMPVIPPDPIICRITLTMENTNKSESLRDLSINFADVFLTTSDSLLGKIEFNSNWDGILNPAELDTIELVKVSESQPIFNPPCSQEVYLNIKIQCDCGSSDFYKTENLIFGCVY